MGKVIRAMSGAAYRHAVKPLLFKQSPDTVHNRMLHSSARLQRSGIVCGLLSVAWAHQNPKMLGQTLHGIYFRNPVGLSAGFDKNFELPPLLKAIGFGFMEGGSLTYEVCPGNPRPWFHRLPNTKSLVVHAGLGNEGVHRIITRLRAYSPQTFTNFPLNISVAKTNSKEACDEADAIIDYVGSLHAVRRAHLGSMITINISCPNTYGGEPFTTPAKLERLLREIDAVELHRPIFIKMPSDLSWPAFDALLRVASNHRISGVTVCNLAKDRSKIKLKDPLPDSVRGGLSGKPTWDLSNELIRKTYLHYGTRFTIIGVGGIFSAEDAYTKIKLGASLVELITGMVFEGPQLIGDINAGLVRLLKRDGYTHISQAVGVDARQ